MQYLHVCSAIETTLRHFKNNRACKNVHAINEKFIFINFLSIDDP